jgi:hypothetical protein
MTEYYVQEENALEESGIGNQESVLGKLASVRPSGLSAQP